MDIPDEIAAKIERHNAIRAEIAAVSERLEQKMPRAAERALADPEAKKKFMALGNKIETAINATQVGTHKAAAIKETLYSRAPDWGGINRALDRALTAADLHVTALRELEVELDALLISPAPVH